MKKLVSLVLLLTSGIVSFGQKMNNDSTAMKSYQPVLGNMGNIPPDSLSKILSSVDQMPEFPGGTKGLIQFLSSNMIYPKKAKKKDIQGKVMAKFIVCEDGSLCNEEIINSIGGGCDEEVLRVIKAMPKWKPGIQAGKPVKVYYTLPVSFKLEDDKEEKK